MWNYLVDIDADPIYFKIMGILSSFSSRFLPYEWFKKKIKLSDEEILNKLKDLEKWGLITYSIEDERLYYDFLTKRSNNSLFDVPTDPVGAIVDMYHTYCPSCRKLKKITPKRRRIIRARWREYPETKFWIEFFKMVEQSDFLTGRTGDFKADLEWLLTNKNFVKVLEGRYNTTKKQTSSNEANDDNLIEEISKKIGVIG